MAAYINSEKKLSSRLYATARAQIFRFYSKIPNETTSSPRKKAENIKMKNLALQEAIRAKHQNRENAIKLKKEDLENAIKRKNLGLKEAIWAKHQDFENALQFKRQAFERYRQLKYQGEDERPIDGVPNGSEGGLPDHVLVKEEPPLCSSDKTDDFNPSSRRNFVKALGDYLKGARSLVAKADDLPTELVKLLWPGGLKYEEMSPMQQSLIQVAGRMLGKLASISAQAVFAQLDMDEKLDVVEDLMDFMYVISPMLKQNPQEMRESVMIKSYNHGWLMSVHAIGFKESDLRIRVDHGCVFVKGEANTLHGKKVINEPVPIPQDYGYDPNSVIAQLIGGEVLVFVPHASKKEKNEECVQVGWGDVMKYLK